MNFPHIVCSTEKISFFMGQKIDPKKAYLEFADPMLLI